MTKKDIIKDFIDGVKKDLKDGVPQEKTANRGTVVLGGRSSPFESFALVQNYRRYFSFEKKKFTPPNRGTTVPPNFSHGRFYFKDFEYKPVNHGKEFLFKNFNFCNILVKKNVVEVTNLKYKDLWLRIMGNSELEIDERLKQIEDELESYCKETLKLFISVYGGKTDYEIIKRVGEVGVPRKDVWDKIPQEMIVHFEPVGKKVYPEKIEYHGVNYVANVLANTGLRRYSKVVSDCLQHTDSKMDSFIEEFLPIHKEHAENIKTHTAVLKNIDCSFNKFNDLLERGFSSKVTHGKSTVALNPYILEIVDKINVYPDDIFKYETDINKLSELEKELLWDFVFSKFGGVNHG